MARTHRKWSTEAHGARGLGGGGGLPGSYVSMSASSTSPCLSESWMNAGVTIGISFAFAFRTLCVLRATAFSVARNTPVSYTHLTLPTTPYV